MMADTVNQLSSKWWTFLVRGIVALVLAAFALSRPGTTANVLVYVVAAYFIVSGVTAIVTGFSFSGVGHWWTLVIMGVVQGGLGFLMLAEPGAGPLALAYLFATWMIMSGVVEISSALALRSYIHNEISWILLGIITLACGTYVVARPDLGLLALIYTIGFYAVFAGIALIAFALRIKSVGADIVGHHANA
jgi:uncharacterized membrane protein HdeD (DUF308 family)